MQQPSISPTTIAEHKENTLTKKKQWAYPQIENFSKKQIQSGGLSLVEALSTLGDLTS